MRSHTSLERALYGTPLSEIYGTIIDDGNITRNRLYQVHPLDGLDSRDS